MLYSYGITPLAEGDFEERCLDIVSQAQRGVILMPLFMMVLVPEGNPVWNKAKKMAALFAKYRDRLEKDGVSCGILVQASLGHGYPLVESPFQAKINMCDGEKTHCCCPEDKGFIEHFCEVLKTLAAEHPKTIMIDDDFRLLAPGRGCGCPLHMKKINELIGLDLSREELWKRIQNEGEDSPIAEAVRKIENETLINTATLFRAAIDSIDPEIQGATCCVGALGDAQDVVSKVFAGKGNPSIIRVPNGSYAPLTVRGFSASMRDAANRGSWLKKRGVDILLAETDTIPFNRYAKSASHLHAHYTASILEGAQGAKHWLSRTSTFELNSGKAYKNILAEHRDFYEALVPIAKDIKWFGINQAFLDQKKFYFNTKYVYFTYDSHFTEDNLERMGLPFYFSDKGEKASILEGNIIDYITDEEIEKFFEGSVFVDGEAGEKLIKRGFGHYLGVEITPWKHGLVKGEYFGENREYFCTPQKNFKHLEIVDSNAYGISYNGRPSDRGAEIFAPAVTVFERDNDKITVVYCGSPNAPFIYTQGFSFLNETRKEQFVSLFKKAGILPIYCHGDEEICFRAGRLSDGTLLAAIYKLGIDPMDSITLYLEKDPNKIEFLQKDGTKREVEFENIGDALYRVDVKPETMMPIILFIM